MDLIVSTMPESSLPSLTPVPRQKMKYADQAIAGRGIPVTYYGPPEETGLSSVILKSLGELKAEDVLPKDILYDYLRYVSYFLPKLHPNWSGYMSDISTGEHPRISTTSLLPIIDLNPTDMTCIYSTLKFVQSQAKNLHKKDQLIKLLCGRLGKNGFLAIQCKRDVDISMLNLEFNLGKLAEMSL